MKALWKYGEIARIQRQFLTRIHVQVGPLVVWCIDRSHACASGLLAKRSPAAKIGIPSVTAEIKEISQIADNEKGQQCSELGAALCWGRIWCPSKQIKTTTAETIRKHHEFSLAKHPVTNALPRPVRELVRDGGSARRQ